jgi:hypothetical protein
MGRSQRLGLVALLALLAGSLGAQVPIASGAGPNTQATEGAYQAWLDLQRQIARSEGRLRDLEKELAEIEPASGAEDATTPAPEDSSSDRPGRAAVWQQAIDTERQRLARLRDDLERLGRLLP